MERVEPSATEAYRRLLARSGAALGVGLAAVMVCYVWVDRPVAFYVHDHGIDQHRAFRWLTYPPPWAQSWTPLVLAALAVRRAWGPFSRGELLLAASGLSLLVADQCRQSLGDVCGRYWPQTWVDNNPSLIGTGAYGFHPFVHGDDVGSFPSGHAARIAGAAGVWWSAVPRSRWLLAVVCLPMLASLVAMNYHFVGDVVAGSVVGGIVAAYAAHVAMGAAPRSRAPVRAATSRVRTS